MPKTIKTGIIGFGLSGQAFHAPFIHTHPQFELCKIVERHNHKSSQLYPYVKTVTSYKKLLEDNEIDLVVHCTPNTLHFPLVKESLQAKKHVVIEKPFTTTSAEAKELIEIARKNQKNIFVFHNRRWDNDFLTIRKIFQSGVLGHIRYFKSHFDRYSPERKRAAWRDEDLPGSGVLFDLGSHLIDQALCLFGWPQHIKADIDKQRPHSIVDDYFNITLYYPHTEVSLTAGMLVKEPGPRYVIHGSRGSFIKYGLDPQENELRKGAMPSGKNWGIENPYLNGWLTIDEDDTEEAYRIESVPGNYMMFYQNIYDVLEQGKQPAVKAEEACDVIRIIERAFQSNVSNSLISLDPNIN